MKIWQKIIYNIIKFYLIKINHNNKIRSLLLWPITSRIFGLDFKTVVRLDKNNKIQVGLDDILNRILLYYVPQVNLCWEPQTIKVARHICKNKKNIVFAGSHIGYTSLQLINYLPKDAVIYSFEPIDYLYEMTKENIAINKLNNRIFIFKEALSDKSEEIMIYKQNIRSSIFKLNAEDEVIKQQKINTIDLDNFQKREKINNFDFLFLDIEGYELKAFQGAENILRHQSPDIIFEVSPKVLKNAPWKEEEIYKYLKQFGYSFYLIEDDYELKNITKFYRKKIKLINLNYYKIDSYKNKIYYNILAIKNKNIINNLNCEIIEK